MGSADRLHPFSSFAIGIQSTAPPVFIRDWKKIESFMNEAG